MHICTHASGGRVGLNCSAGRVEIVGSNNRFVGCGFNNFTRPVEPLGWVGGFGDQIIRGVDAGRIRYPLTEGTGSDVCSQTPFIYVQFYMGLYIYIYKFGPFDLLC